MFEQYTNGKGLGSGKEGGGLAEDFWRVVEGVEYVWEGEAASRAVVVVVVLG